VPRNTPQHDDDEALAAGLILPGGKVDAAAVRRAVEQAEAEGMEDDSAIRTVVFRIRRDLAKRLDRYLTDRIGFISRTQLQKLIEEGGVLVNGRQPKASTRIGAGDVIEVVIPPPPATNIQPEDIPLDVLYEDEHIIVLNKQDGIIVHPARSHLKGTLLSALAFHFKHRSTGTLSKVGEEFARPGVVHRLDRHTSGCIVFAKTDEAHWKLAHQFEHRTVDKRYLAVVHGHVEPDVQIIDLPIGPHPSREKGYREKYVVRHDDLGKPAVTIVRVRERYSLPVPDRLGAPSSVSASPGDPVTKSGRYSLVELELKTGRTHQIRVHLSSNLWPIVGDDMYAGAPFLDETGRTVIARQALHACTLGFRHPITDKPMEFTAPLRPDMAELVWSLRRCFAVERATSPGTTIDLSRAIPPPANHS
jgi:23S rRNA pseudouridine1911/1915/1917 synthase